MVFNPHSVRPLFPALNQEQPRGKPLFLDGPGGTQVPLPVLDAMRDYLGTSNGNLTASPFFAVQRTHEVVRDARVKAAAFVNAPGPENIVFGANMTTITSHFSRSIAREWKAGDEIIVTALDHFSNVSFWRQEAADRGVTCHVLRIKPEDCTLDYDHLAELLSDKTKLVAFTLASNVSGSLSDAPRIIKMAKAVGAMTYVDSVHYAPHYLPDAQALDCDFLTCSAYKFFGPHMGFIYGKTEHLTRLKPFKVEPALLTPPDCWETGTKSFEDLAGFSATINYLAGQSSSNDLRTKLKESYKTIAVYEQNWSRAFLKRAAAFKGMKVYGITDPARVHERTCTFSFTIDGHAPQKIVDHLAKHNISAGAGSFYGNGVTDALGLTDNGGIVRVGALHYNTLEDIERLFTVLETL